MREKVGDGERLSDVYGRGRMKPLVWGIGRRRNGRGGGTHAEREREGGGTHAESEREGGGTHAEREREGGGTHARASGRGSTRGCPRHVPEARARAHGPGVPHVPTTSPAPPPPAPPRPAIVF